MHITATNVPKWARKHNKHITSFITRREIVLWTLEMRFKTDGEKGLSRLLNWLNRYVLRLKGAQHCIFSISSFFFPWSILFSVDPFKAIFNVCQWRALLRHKTWCSHHYKTLPLNLTGYIHIIDNNSYSMQLNEDYLQFFTFRYCNVFLKIYQAKVMA